MRNPIEDDRNNHHHVVAPATRRAAVASSRTAPLVVAASALTLALVAGCAKRPPNGPEAGAAQRTAPPPSAAVQEPSPAPPAPAGREKPDAAQPSQGATARPADAPSPGPPSEEAGSGELPRTERQTGARISTYYLSPGDEIRVSVLGYEELTRTVRIPPDGHLFFPMVGDISADGMSIPELRKLITEKLQAADDQRIVAGDQIQITVYRQADLSLTTIVPSSGRVNVPLAGDVDLGGRTVEEARQAITEKMKRFVVNPSVSTVILKSASGIPGRITDPHVSVEVMAFGGHKVLVLGEVARPGVYVSEGGSRLLEMLARAGGPTADAKLRNVALIRPGTETTPPRTALVNLTRVLSTGALEENPTVQRGDVIYVPRSTIANVAQFFSHVYSIVRPFVTVETGIWLGQNIEAGPRERAPGVVFQ